MEKIEFELKKAEKTVRELLIADIVEIELCVNNYTRELNNHKCDDENLVTAILTIEKIKLVALKQALIDDDFEL